MTPSLIYTRYTSFNTKNHYILVAFFDDIVCELILRDVLALLASFTRRNAQGLGAFAVNKRVLKPQQTV